MIDFESIWNYWTEKGATWVTEHKYSSGDKINDDIAHEEVRHLFGFIRSGEHIIDLEVWLKCATYQGDVVHKEIIKPGNAFQFPEIRYTTDIEPATGFFGSAPVRYQIGNEEYDYVIREGEFFLRNHPSGNLDDPKNGLECLLQKFV